MNDPLIIIGSGLAGYLFAKEWRKLNTNTPLLIISEDDAHFYSKPLLSNALAKQKTPDSLVTTDRDAMAAQLNATILPHQTVTSINPASRAIILDDGSEHRYHTLILATGASPMTPPLRGDVDALLQVNSLAHYRPFYNRLQTAQDIIILGAGLIGCEFANDCLSIGKKVHVISMETQPLSQLVPSTVGSALQRALKNAGVQWHCGQTATAIEQSSQQVSLTLASGETVSGDLAVAAIGIRPNLTLAIAAGIETKRGILVDPSLATNQPHIYALGDAIEYNGRIDQYISPILIQARLLAHNLNHDKDQQKALCYPIMPVTIKTPACPIVCVPPTTQDGEWRTEQADNGIIARHYNSHEEIDGFALTEGCIRQRQALIKSMSAPAQQQ